MPIREISVLAEREIRILPPNVVLQAKVLLTGLATVRALTYQSPS